jgi:type VI protein secretion system component Hcp
MKKLILFLAFLIFHLGMNAQIEPKSFNKKDLVNTTTQESFQYFMKIDGINGDSKDAKHLNWIICSSLFFEIKSNMINGQVTGKPVFTLMIYKGLDATSGFFLESMSQNKLFPKVQIEVVQNINNKWLTVIKYDIKNVRISSYSVGENELSNSLEEKMHVMFESNVVTNYTYDTNGVLIATKNTNLGISNN